MDIQFKSQWTKKCVRRTEIVSSRVAIVTGGHDRCGRCLVTVDGQEQMVHPLSIASIVDLFEFLVQTVPEETSWSRGLALLMDARNCDKDCVQAIVSVIDQLQISSVCRVAVFYAIQPKTSRLQSLMKKMSGIRKSKTQSTIASFQTVIVKDVAELQRYIDVDQLTDEFGGFLKFNHGEWVKFIQTMDEFDERMRSVLNQVPMARDEMNMLLEYELLSASMERQLLLQIRSRYNEIMQRLNVEHAIDECKALAEMLRDAPRHDGLCEIRASQSVSAARERLRQYEGRLIDDRTELRSTWQSAELRIIALAKLRKYQAKAEKILLWIEDVGSIWLASVPSEVDATNEDDKYKFTENILPAIKNVICLSENIRRKMRQIVADQKSFSIEVSSFDQQFGSAVDRFRKEAKRKELMIIGRSKASSSSSLSSAPFSAIGSIPLSSDGAPQSPKRGIFECLQQLNDWYRTSLEFLGRNRPPYQMRSVNGYQELSYQSSSSWNEALKGFVDDHPLPPTDHIKRLRSIVPAMDSLPDRINARALVNRVKLLIKLFTGEKLLSLEDMDEMYSWQVKTPNTKFQNLASSEAETDSCKGDIAQLLMSARQKISIEHSQTDASSAKNNSGKYWHEDANLSVEKSDRRGRRITRNGQTTSLSNGKTEPGTLADLDMYKIPVQPSNGRENLIDGSDPAVERYISLDSKSLDALRKDATDIGDRMLGTALLSSSIVNPTAGNSTFANDHTCNRTISVPARKEPAAGNESNDLTGGEERTFLQKTRGNELSPVYVQPVTQTRPSPVGLVDNFHSMVAPETADKSTEITATEKSVEVAKSDSFLYGEPSKHSADKAVKNTEFLEKAGNPVDLASHTPSFTTTAEKPADLATTDEWTEEEEEEAVVPLRQKQTTAERRASGPEGLWTRERLKQIADSPLRPEDKLRLLSRLSDDLDEDIRRTTGGGEGVDAEEMGDWRNCLSLYSEISLVMPHPEDRARTLPQNGPHNRLHDYRFPFSRPIDAPLSSTNHLRPLSNLSSNDTTDLESIPSSALSLAFDEVMQEGKPARGNGSPSIDYDLEIEELEQGGEEEEEEDSFGCDIEQSSVAMRTEYHSASEVSSLQPDGASFDSMDEHIQRLRIAKTNRKLDAFELEMDRIRLQKLLAEMRSESTIIDQ